MVRAIHINIQAQVIRSKKKVDTIFPQHVLLNPLLCFVAAERYVFRGTKTPLDLFPFDLHFSGHTATKDISFRKVIETIRDNAFVTSNLPVIVSLEVHTCRDQQEIMVEIMKECFKDHLVDVNVATNPELPSPKALKNKILIKVKYSPPKAPEEATEGPKDKLSKVITSSSKYSNEDESVTSEDATKSKPSKIIDALSQLGVYTRSYHFKGLDQPEATIPTHVFSLSETALMEVHKNNPTGLFNHNKRFLMRAYPKGIRVSSSNLDPTLFWRQGVQMVALNWQKFDAGVMLNEGMFANTGGWVLKPVTHRGEAQLLVGNDGSHGSKFSIEILAGQNIPLPKEISAADFHPLVKCELHVEVPGDWEPMSTKEKDGEFKAKTKASKGCNPDFKGQLITFDKLPSIAPELGFVR
jgi:hypothetical protein